MSERAPVDKSPLMTCAADVEHGAAVTSVYLRHSHQSVPRHQFDLDVTLRHDHVSSSAADAAAAAAADQSSARSLQGNKGKGTLDIAPLCESSPQKRSGMTRVLKRSHSFTCTPSRSSAIGMSHTCPN